MVVDEGLAGVLEGERGVRLGVMVSDCAHCVGDTEPFSTTGWQLANKIIVERRMVAHIDGRISGFLLLSID